jgi:2,3-diketo-5-methylthiopentyl-1-phosphate enolase
MGILKPNVGMSVEKIGRLYEESADAGLHFIKDDEIRFDETKEILLNRVYYIANQAAQKNLKTIYVVNLPSSFDAHFIKQLEEAGAMAFLCSPWLFGFDALQNLRQWTSLPLFAHPAFAGALVHADSAGFPTLHPRVALASCVRAAGADFSLFPSPYGKIGLSMQNAQAVASECVGSLVRDENSSDVCLPCIPVPSAGVKWEHASMARRDFGQDFVLNAGTGIFSNEVSISQNIRFFLNGLINE